LTAVAVGLICVVVAAIVPSAQAASPPQPTVVGPPTQEWSWAARVLAPAVVRAEPDPTAKSLGLLQPTAPLAGGPMVLLVLESRVVAEIEWTRVLLARRPNGTSGWIRSDVLRFRLNPMRIVIDQSDRTTYVFRNNRRVLRVRNAVGTASTPTPMGRFAIAEKISIPSGFLGPLVLPTTGFSEVLNEYAGGNGRFALHGTSLPGLIGTRASHGCIRHKNADIRRIAVIVSPGTPIVIRP
jgi:lipoprotein-anchoring transpeptidase ErfK/SrfK